MSLVSIRAAFKKKLNTANLPIANENASFNPTEAAYCEFHMIPATPVDSVLGSEFHFEVGIAQITLVYPAGKGTGPGEAKAHEIRNLFFRGLTLIEDGIQVEVTKTPAEAKGFPDGGYWRIPISVSWQAQIINP